MDSPQEIAFRIRKHSSHSREQNRGPIKATEPIPSTQRRFSEVVPREKPSSQSGRRASSGSLVTAKVSPNNVTSNEVQAPKQRPSSSQSLDNESLSARRAIMLQRQNATTVDPDSQTENLKHYEQYYLPHTPPRPPSQPRPKSAKVSRPRSGSRPLSGGPAIDVTHPLPHSPMSFSKYKPLPSIGSRPSSGSSSSSRSYDHAVIQLDQQVFEKTFSKKIDEMSLTEQYNIPDEPSEHESNRIHLAIKVLDGSRHERWFRLSDRVGDILAFAELIMGEKLPENCEICTNELPRRTFSNLSQTLEDIGLQSRTVLHIQEQ